MKQIKNVGILMILVALMISFQSNAQQKKTDKILKDPEKREQVMTAISNNPEMRKEMMKMMMEKDSTMMKGMKGMKEKMMMGMEKDSIKSKKMKEKMATMKENKDMKCDCKCKDEEEKCQCQMKDDDDKNKDKNKDGEQ
tara:strand:- start:1248 stop:1664 length:417 start_codon:yes stop_codon:yes gene_type:complete